MTASLLGTVVSVAVTVVLSLLFGSIWLRVTGLTALAYGLLRVWDVVVRGALGEPLAVVSAVLPLALGGAMWLAGHYQYAHDRGYWKSRVAWNCWSRFARRPAGEFRR